MEFEYVIYALGSRLPGPIDLWAGEEGAGEEAVAGSDEGTVEGEKPTQESATVVSLPASASESTEDDTNATGSTSTTTKPYTGTKAEAVEWMRRCQDRIKKIKSVLVVGGGALGIRECCCP